MPDALAGILPAAGILGSTATGAAGGGGISSILPWILGLSGVAGTVGNIQANAARNKVLSSEMGQMNALEKLTPSAVTSGITALEQPLSSNLTSSVGNTVQAQLAQRGLSQAPGIFASSLAQGLAPYQLQEQQLAQNAYFQQLGLPISARPSPFGPFPQSTNTNQIWQMLMQRFMNPYAAAGTNPGGIPNFDPTMNYMTTTGPNPLPASSGGGSDIGDVNSLNFFNMLGLNPGLTSDTSGGIS